jgi:predicted alpha/beta-fold hydrolase
VLETPDGDEVVLDHLEGEAPAERVPRLLALHGLEGSSRSVYIQGLCALAAARGWSATAINFRSCARDPFRPRRTLLNRTSRLYHSGETSDFGLVVETLAQRLPERPLVAFGGSLGGNVLLKWLGENPGQTRIAASVAVSTPYDLLAGARMLERGSGRLYGANFLTTLKPKALSVLKRFPELSGRLEERKIRRARTLMEFDEVATAPLHGFAGAEDYYAKSSSLAFLGRITAPTLCLSALDDPFLPPSAVAAAEAEASRAVEFVIPVRGGHLGFVEGSPWKPRFWAEGTAIEWLARRLDEV